MFRARKPWLRMYLWASAALGLLGATEAAALDTVITSQPPSFTSSNSATFTFTADEAGASFECKLDTSAFTACSSPITYLSLATGSHSFQVRAKDAAGTVDASPASYTWTVDRTAPDTFITARPPNPSSSTSATFSFNSNEATASFECRLDTASFTPCTSPADFTGLAAGSHTFQVRARDAAGNLDASPASYTWSVDTTAPNTFITSPQPPNSTSATITFSSNEAPVTFECMLDATTFVPCTSPVTLSGLSDGSHTFQVRARDAAGNLDPTPASTSWTVDTTAPETTITGQPPNPSNSTSATFTFSANDPAASFECSLDMGGFAPCTSPLSYATLADGNHTFQVRARDSAGNVEATPAIYDWAVDIAAPDTFITAQPPNPSSSTSATFSFASTKAGPSFECKLDASAYAPCTSPITYSGMAEGSHTFQVRARDAAGNLDPSPASYTWVVDSVAPDTTITSQPPDPSSSPSATLTFTSNDAAASFECALDSATFSACTSPATFSSLGDGSHTFTVRARDAAGNVDPTPARVTWTVDTAAPDTFITSPPPSAPGDTITFTSNETPVTFRCSLDSAPFGPCTSPVTPPATLAEGVHTFAVSATDAAGHADPTPATLSWVVDPTPPDTTITSQPPISTRETSAQFTFTSEAGSTFECSLDESPFKACTSPKDYTQLLESDHFFQVRARDAAGNVDPTPASHAWTVDLTAPDTTLVQRPADPSYTASATFSFTSSESPSTFECRLDTAPLFAPCPSPMAYTGLTEGRHTFQVRAVDAAGNTDATPASFSWIVNALPPEAPVIVSPSQGATITQRQPPISGTAQPGSTVAVQLDRADLGTTMADLLGKWTITPASRLREGPHLLMVTATDGAGTSAPSEPVFFTVDTHGPPNDPPDHGCGCGAGSADTSLLLWGLGLLATLGARRRARRFNRP